MTAILFNDAERFEKQQQQQQQQQQKKKKKKKKKKTGKRTVQGVPQSLKNNQSKTNRDNMPSTEGPKCNLVKIGQDVSEKKTFKDYEILYMYIAKGQEQIPQEDKILIVTKRVCFFDHIL